MAQLKAVPGVAKVTFKGAFTSGASTANVLHVDRAEFESGPWTQAEIDTMVTALRGFFVTRFIPVIHSSWQLGVVEAVDLTSDVGVLGIAAGTTAGGIGASALPANVAQAVTWKISRHYRGGHPRTYLAPPGAANASLPNSWQTTHITAVKAAATGFLGDVNGLTIGGDTCRLTAVHRYRGWTVEPSTGRKIPTQLATPLKSYVVAADFDSRIDSQRRRLGRDR